MKNNLHSTRGEVTTTTVIAIVALGALVGLWAMPKFFHGASRRAHASTVATAKLEEATKAQGSAAAASVAKIAEANAQAPDSPAKEFVASEAPLALTFLPPPDPDKLLEAERRRAAVMEGKYEEAQALYAQAYKRAEKLQAERDEALAARRAADLALERAAAAEHAGLIRQIGLGAIVLLVAAGWIWARVNGLSLKNLTTWAYQVKQGEDPIVAMDGKLSPRLQQIIAEKVAVLQAKKTNNTA